LCENSSIEQGLKFSDKANDTMNKLIEFNNEKIYKNNMLKPMIRYCTLFMNELFSLLKNQFDGENTVKNLKRFKKFYPELTTEFLGWISNYSILENRDEEKYNNKIIFDITNEKDYKKAIITYLSGMTDKYIVKMYNTLISI
jgi:dGTPase